MEKINNISGIHKNKPIWIAGSGPSLDTYPDDFFKNKIGITLHMAFLKYPETTYMYANESDRVTYLKNTHPNFCNVKHIYGLPFFGISKISSKKLIYDIPNIYYYSRRAYPPYGIRGRVNWAFTRVKVRQAKNGKGIFFGGHGSCLHGALFCAIMLGGNPINLIGNGHGMYKGKEHFAGAFSIDKNMRPSAPSFSDPNNNVPIIEQTMAIIEACRQEGIQVNWIKEYSDTGEYENYNLSKEMFESMKVNYKRKFPLGKRIKNVIKTIYNPIINKK